MLWLTLNNASKGAQVQMASLMWANINKSTYSVLIEVTCIFATFFKTFFYEADGHMGYLLGNMLFCMDHTGSYYFHSLLGRDHIFSIIVVGQDFLRYQSSYDHNILVRDMLDKLVR